MTLIRNTRAIGMFDSGIGGLTVMKQLTKLMPHEHVVYFGDTARVPYGNKSRDTIIRYSIENTIFLMQQDIKALVIACNTASSYAVDKLQKIFNIPIVGTIEPCADSAVEVTKNKKIAVLGTKATINSGRFQEEILKRLPDAVVIGVACPLFVPLVEEQFISHTATKQIVKEYLSAIKHEGVDTVILGCTHYPLLQEIIQDELGQGVMIVDAARACSEVVSQILKKRELDANAEQKASYRYFVTDDPDKFRSTGERFLGMPLSQVESTHLCA